MLHEQRAAGTFFSLTGDTAGPWGEPSSIVCQQQQGHEVEHSSAQWPLYQSFAVNTGLWLVMLSRGYSNCATAFE
jgi:hypothetical protein